MYLAAKAVQPLSDYRLLVTFANGEQRILDVTPWLDTGVFRQLRDVALFNTVHISFDTVAWNNGADLCPELIHEQSVAVAVAERSRAVAEAPATYTAQKKRD
jgi:hypothetical protein